MAKKQTKPVPPDCIECIHHFNPHCKGDKGKPILCQCRKHPERHRFCTKDGCYDFNR